MIYSQDIRNGFADAVGERGLGKAVFDANLRAAEASIARLRAARDDASLPILLLPELTADLDILEPIARRYRSFDHVVILGTGGSSLGGQALYALVDEGFGPPPGTPRLHFIDNVDPHTFESLFRRVDLRRTGFIVISKSGGTAETVAQFIVCLAALADAVGDERVADHALVITENTDNPLRRLAENHRLPSLDHDPGVGGRYSVFSLVGILPAMIAGLDPRQIRGGAKQVLDATLGAASAADSEPARGAAWIVGLLESRRLTNSVIMPYVDRLAQFGLWYMQLWAESIGKDGKGTTPIRAMGTRDQHSQLQLYLDGPRDKSFTLVTLDMAASGRPVCTGIACDANLYYLDGRTMGDLLEAEQQATAETLARNGCPTRIFTLPHLDAKGLGALMMHFMLETIIAADLMKVNAFDQPAVEEGKARARQYLADMRASEMADADLAEPD